MKNRPELLTPVQDWNSLKVISGLTDAIYFGVQSYNMRVKAKNFERIDLEKVANYCHDQNPPMKAYLTTNILIYDSELQYLVNLIAEAKEAGIDAIIARAILAREDNPPLFHPNKSSVIPTKPNIKIIVRSAKISTS